MWETSIVATPEKLTVRWTDESVAILDELCVDYSIRGLVDLTGMSRSTLQRIRTGKGRPSFESLTILDARLEAQGRLLQFAFQESELDKGAALKHFVKFPSLYSGWVWFLITGTGAAQLKWGHWTRDVSLEDPELGKVFLTGKEGRSRSTPHVQITAGSRFTIRAGVGDPPEHYPQERIHVGWYIADPTAQTMATISTLHKLLDSHGRTLREFVEWLGGSEHSDAMIAELLQYTDGTEEWVAPIPDDIHLSRTYTFYERHTT